MSRTEYALVSNVSRASGHNGNNWITSLQG